VLLRISRTASRCQTLPVCTIHVTGYFTDVGTLLGWCDRDGVTGEKFLKARGELGLGTGSVFQNITKIDSSRKGFSFHSIPVVPHKAVAEVSKIGNL